MNNERPDNSHALLEGKKNKTNFDDGTNPGLFQFQHHDATECISTSLSTG